MAQRKHAELMIKFVQDDSLVKWMFDTKLPLAGWMETNDKWLDHCIYELHPAGVMPNWITWTGGECPVHPESEVITILKDGTFLEIEKAGKLDWENHPSTSWDHSREIICYRVIKEAEPANPHQAMIDEHKRCPEKVVQYLRKLSSEWFDCLGNMPCWNEDYKYRFKLPHQELRDMAEADPSLKWEEKDVYGKFQQTDNPQWRENREYRHIPKTKPVRKWLWNMYKPDGGVYMTNTYTTEEQIKKTLIPIHSRTDQYIDVEEKE